MAAEREDMEIDNPDAISKQLIHEPLSSNTQLEQTLEELPQADEVTTSAPTKLRFRKIFLKRNKTGKRLRIKKQRKNRQLRKAIVPKSALMALKELKGVTISPFTIKKNLDSGFTATVTINSNQYEGQGLSKTLAKNSACEKAWRDYIIGKMTPKSELPMAEAMDTNDDESKSPNDDLPFLNLACFAIFKLFGEWKRDGYLVPGKHLLTANLVAGSGDAAAGSPLAKEKKPPVRTELPSGWETMHPSSILCIMRPGFTYLDQKDNSSKPDGLQHLRVVVDGQEFTSSGRSKKIARRNVAITVCNTLFGTNFSMENGAA